MELEGLRNAGLQYGAIHGVEGMRKLDTLLSRSFQVGPGASFFDDFPIWHERFGANARRLGAYEGDRLVASACARVASLKSPIGEVPVALIGAVAADAAWRGRGLASLLVSAVANWAHREGGAALTLLWGSEHSMYERLGFGVHGRQARLPLVSIEKPADASVRLQSGWVPALFDCLQARPGGLALQAADQAWIVAHKNVSWWWTGTAEKPSAYAAVGRGIDLGGLVHEWGGDPVALRGLLGALNERVPGLELLAAPDQAASFGVRSDRVQVETLCLAAIHDAERVHDAFGDNLWIWGLDSA